MRRNDIARLLTLSLFVLATPARADSLSGDWLDKWPNTNLSKHTPKAHEVYPAPNRTVHGPPTAINNPADRDFQAASTVDILTAAEPVISVVIDDDARAYPLNYITKAHMVNDTVGGTPVLVTFCILCNSSVVFDRRVDGRALDFDTSYLLLDANLVMYDRQTESWWPQLLGEGIAGEMTGKQLDIIPARIESFESFRKRYPDGKVLISDGQPPLKKFSGYGERRHKLFNGKMPDGIDPFMYVVTVGDQAWSMDLLREKKRIVTEDNIVITWSPNLKSGMTSEGVDHGNVVVQQVTPDGPVDVVYGLEFAFAFVAFHPDAKIHVR